MEYWPVRLSFSSGYEPEPIIVCMPNSLIFLLVRKRGRIWLIVCQQVETRNARTPNTKHQRPHQKSVHLSAWVGRLLSCLGQNFRCGNCTICLSIWECWFQKLCLLGCVPTNCWCRMPLRLVHYIWIAVGNPTSREFEFMKRKTYMLHGS